MKVSAFTFIKNGQLLGYPFIQSIKSVINPYLALNLSDDAGSRPCLRQTSAVGIPDSCSLTIPIIWAFAKRHWHICLFPQGLRILYIKPRDWGIGPCASFKLGQLLCDFKSISRTVSHRMRTLITNLKQGDWILILEN